jgi:hypothetical protein
VPGAQTSLTWATYQYSHGPITPNKAYGIVPPATSKQANDFYHKLPVLQRRVEMMGYTLSLVQCWEVRCGRSRVGPRVGPGPPSLSHRGPLGRYCGHRPPARVPGPRLDHPLAVWVLDGSDFPKQGVKSVGVAQQYCGVLGKVASCQAGVFLAHVGPRGRALVDKRLYLPEGWTRDPPRRTGLGCPRPRKSTGRKPTWPWRCCGKPELGGTSAPIGSRETTPSGCPRTSVTAWRQRGCSTSWRSRPTHRSGSLNPPGAPRLTRGAGGPVGPRR